MTFSSTRNQRSKIGWIRLPVSLFLFHSWSTSKLAFVIGATSYWEHSVHPDAESGATTMSWTSQTGAIPPPYDAAMEGGEMLHPQAPIWHAEQERPPPALHAPLHELDLPLVDLNQVSLSLRLTCEVNRKLQVATQQSRRRQHRVHEVPGDATRQAVLRGGFLNQQYDEDTGVHVHPSQSWQPPIPPTSSLLPDNSSNEEELTVFHAKAPRPSKKQRRGAARWGPDLQLYLKHLLEEVLLDDSGSSDSTTQQQQQKQLLILAMIYLDRACSTETPRGLHRKCPYVTPRTVHRLVLTALCLARQSLSTSSMTMNAAHHSTAHQMHSKIAESLGIPPAQLRHMQESMMQALGEAGLYVSPMELAQWSIMWERTWNKQKKQHGTSVQPPQPDQSRVVASQQHLYA